MALKVGELEADVDLKDKGFESGLNKAESRFGKFARSVAEKSGSLGKGIAGGIGKGVSGVGKMAGPPLLAAGLAAGALFVGGLTQAMDIQDANAQLKAQLGLSTAETAKAGKIAGDLYKNAYGESVAEVNDVLKTVFQSGIAGINASEDAIKGVSAQVMNFSKISGEEALPVTRAVSQMLKTGLAKNATQAFDILTRGQQLGINKSEDLLDTFNEYGTQWRKIGIDGPLALGLMNQAIQAGARDSDIAADAIKEFAIRAVDGSTLTSNAMKDLGFNAGKMADTFAKGGPKATAALGQVLDKLRAVKDPAERSRIAVALFGTQAEDLGDALYAMDTSTAVKSLGNVEGAADRAGTALSDTFSSKITTVKRTLQMAIVDAIGKYVLPKLEEFADWFTGPGKFVMVSWALSSGSAILGFADKMLGALGGMIGGLSKFAAVALIAAAGAVAAFNPSLALDMVKQARSMDQWADSARKGIGDARSQLQGWKDQVDKTNTKVKFEANIADLDAKIAKAQKELKDPGLTKTRTAQLKAEIRQLQQQKAKALGTLNDPNLVKRRVAKLEADKRTLDTKIAQAKRALASKDLTRERRATLNANIANLLRQKRNAQAAIDSLRGKTVTITAKLNAANIRNQVNYALARAGFVEGRAIGGPVKKGTPYVVGEHRPELFVPDEDGTIVPQVPPTGSGSPFGSSSTLPSIAQVELELRSSGSAVDNWLIEILRKGIKLRGGNVQRVLGP